MSEKWWRRKRRSEWDAFFEEFDKLEKMVDDMMQGMSEEHSAERRERKPNPYVFGFSVSVGPDGKPRVQRFGTPQSSLQGTQIREEREPLVDVMETKGEVVIVVELPGVEKDDIKLDLTESALTINVGTDERKYYKKLSLPAKVQSKTMQTNYKNGVLEVRMKKADGKPFPWH